MEVQSMFLALHSQILLVMGPEMECEEIVANLLGKILAFDLVLCLRSTMQVPIGAPIVELDRFNAGSLAQGIRKRFIFRQRKNPLKLFNN